MEIRNIPMFISVKKQHIKELNKFALPLIIQNITGMLIGLVDEMFIGRISTEAYGAIGIMAVCMVCLVKHCIPPGHMLL